MEDMMAEEEALEVDLDLVIEGLDMIMAVDMNVRWGAGLGILKTGLVDGTWVVVVDIKVVPLTGIQDVAITWKLPTQ